MREIKFRGKRADNGEWEYGSYLLCEKDKPYIGTPWLVGSVPTKWEVDPATVGQFTGLYDSTKWEQLSEQEKQEFYNKHCSEDGRTVKYQNVDDVKRLWKGREIYEGDIVEVTDTPYYAKRGKVVFNGKEYGLLDADDGFCADFAWEDREHYFKVIGNIFEHPELLK